MIMIARIRAAESIPIPSGGPLNKGTLFSHAGVAISSWRTKRHEHEDTPQAVDDGRDGRQQLSQEDQRRRATTGASSEM